MEKVLNFQLSLFGSFVNVQPNLLLTNRIAENLRDDSFVPSIAVVNAIDPVKKQVITENRLQMESKDHTWHIVFFAERIDIDYTYPGGDAFYTDVKDIIAKGKELCTHTFKAIADTTGIRIAVNGRFLVNDMSAEEKQKFIRRFAIIPQVFESNLVTEWNVHFNAPKELVFGDKKDICNNILEVYDILGIDPRNQTVSPRMAIGLDINTNQANTDQKYKYTDILYFADVAGELMDSALREIEGDK